MQQQEITFTFGKHNGKTVSEVYSKDINYINWFEKECKGKYPTIQNEIDKIRNTVLFTFGKHKGKSVEDVYNKDYDYISWLKDNLDEVKHYKIFTKIKEINDEKWKKIEAKEEIELQNKKYLAKLAGKEDCAICLTTLIDEYKFDCKHEFCAQCIQKLIQHTCPLCRKPFNRTYFDMRHYDGSRD